MTRITKEPEERKQEILDAAMKLFSEKGYDKTSISDIAESLKIAQGLCYRYFASKEALFEAAIDHYADMQVSKMLPILCDGSKTPREKILCSPAYPQIESEGSDYYRVFHGEGSRPFHDRLSLRLCEKLTPLLAKQLQNAQEAGEIHVDDARTAASFFIYGQLGILLSHDLAPEEKSRRIRQFQLKMLELF
ncbi:transcriptional regulator [Clostridium sp. W14A]|uniref:TetR/AcrR family transcriptional regulator n=1 Tax=Caproicibacter fermentans TaxID=2576756 RepID=A0A7G8T767_9FIRM|nr:TetR/AcrR family transcriptional regulator [Caproicibacter fermentans]OCN01629.1 transcriptional regulator [Clostridium sp. W14A]QNK39458.1 TetR/AcrR family transcriptional regulator [Caproicibacter fermentans]